MKPLVCLPFLLMASWASAVFDLQHIARYKSSLPVDTAFKFVQPGPGGTTYVAGNVASDVVIAQFDAFGTLLKTQIWDSPYQSTDQVQGFWVNANGSLNLRIRSTNPAAESKTFLVQFASSFAKNWDASFTFPVSHSVHADVDASGVTYLVLDPTPAGQAQLRIIDANGLITASTGFDLDRVGAVAAVPTPGTGCVVAGSRNDLHAVARLSGTGTTIHQTNLSGSLISPSNMLYTVATDSTGVIFAGGTHQPALATFAGRLIRVDASGSNLQAINLGGTETVRKVYRTGTSTVRAVVQSVSSGRIVEADLSSATITRTDNVPEVPQDVVYLSGIDTRYISLPSRNLYRIAPAPTLPATLAAHVEAIQGSTATKLVGVGESDLSGTYMAIEGVSSYENSHQISAGPDRNLNNSVTATDGATTLAFEHFRLGRTESTISRYRPNGTLQWARMLVAPGIPDIRVLQIASTADNGVLVAGTATPANAGSLLFIARISATGAQTWLRTYGGVNPYPIAITQLGDGSVACFLVQGLLKTNSTGFAQTYAPLGEAPGTGLFSGDMHVLSSGKLALVYHMQKTGGAEHIVTQQLDPTTGASEFRGESTFTNARDFRSALDPAGNLVVATLNASNEMGLSRRSGTNLQTLLNQATYTSVDRIAGIAFGPNGRAAIPVSTLTNDDFELRLIDNTFSSFLTGTIAPGATITGVTVDSTNVTYVVGTEQGTDSKSTYAARFLPTGVRSAQRRIAGTPLRIQAVPTLGVWLSGTVANTKQGLGPFVARYSL